MLDTAAIRALADAATPGPCTSYGHDGAYAIARVLGLCNTAPPHMTAQHYHDALFVPAARNNIPALCDELDALREQLDAAQTALVDAETVKRERDALRAKVAKLRELAAPVIAADDKRTAQHYADRSDEWNNDDDRQSARAGAMRDMLAILDEVNNA